MVGALQHGRQGTLAPRQGLLAGLVGMLFAIPGALVAFAVPVEVLRTGFGVFLLLGSYRMFRALRRPRCRPTAGVTAPERRGISCRPTVNKEPTMSDAPREKTFLLAPAEGRVLDWLARAHAGARDAGPHDRARRASPRSGSAPPTG